MTQAAVGQPISVQGRYVLEDDQLQLAGDWTFHTENWRGRVIDTIWVICPCGCGVRFRLPLSPIKVVQGTNPAAQEQPSIPDTWGWDGSKEAPRLIPSILRNGGCKYHGHLTRGHWSGARE